jgi:hypothetical protein
MNGCVVNKIQGRLPTDVEIRRTLDCTFGRTDREFKMQTVRNTIRLCREEDALFEIAADIFCTDNRDHDCAVVALVGALLHELTHTCGASHPDNPRTREDESPCDIPHLVGSAFTWAVFQQYPLAAASPCCEAFVGSQRAVLDVDDPLPNLSHDCGDPSEERHGGPSDTGGRGGGTKRPLDDFPPLLRPDLRIWRGWDDSDYDVPTIILDGVEILI